MEYAIEQAKEAGSEFEPRLGETCSQYRRRMEELATERHFSEDTLITLYEGWQAIHGRSDH
jgi:hypothetical protein